MEACVAVEKEIDKVLGKFASIRDHGSRTVEDLIDYLSNIKRELEQGNCCLIALLIFPLKSHGFFKLSPI